MVDIHNHNVTIKDLSSYAAPMQSCQCSGENYFGLPNIEFGLLIDQYETHYAYKMSPLRYMTLPKVDPYLRVSKCQLGLWNLQQVIPSQDEEEFKQFAVGQNFLREYNMTMRFLKTEKDQGGSRSISVLLYIGNAERRDTIMSTIAMMFFTGFLLLAYLAYFSVLKFRRVKKESE